MIKSKLKITLSRDESQKGIWQFSSYLEPVPEAFRLSLKEGGTRELSFEEGLILKREDENPTGSLKDRGLAFLVSWAWSQGAKNLVLSSSGNAAIAASRYCQLAQIDLTVFVSPKIDPQKRMRIKGRGVTVTETEKAVSEAVKFSQKNGFLNLRPSQSEFGSEGYQTIAFELAEEEGLLEDIFIPVSSGAGLIGIAKGFKKLGFLPRIHVCQSAAVCPIASLFTRDFLPEEKSLAEALVAKFTPLRNEVIEAVKESRGTGWVISNGEIKEALELLSQKGIETSAEGALAVAAWKKAGRSGRRPGKAVCLLTGKKY